MMKSSRSPLARSKKFVEVEAMTCHAAKLIRPIDCVSLSRRGVSDTNLIRVYSLETTTTLDKVKVVRNRGATMYAFVLIVI